MKALLLDDAQPPSSKILEPSIFFSMYMLGAKHVQLEHPKRKDLFRTKAAHGRSVHTQVTPRSAFKVARALSQAAKEVQNAPKKMVYFAVPKSTVILDTNLDAEPVPAPQREPHFRLMQ